MDGQDYNNLNNQNQNFVNPQDQQMPPEEYPSENEITSSQNSNNTPQQNYCPPPVPQDMNQPPQPGNIYQNPPPGNIYQNPPPENINQNPVPKPQAPLPPYMTQSPPWMNPPSAVPPPVPVGNDVSYQPVNYNQNAVAIPVQPQPPIIVQQPVVVQPVVKVQHNNYDYEMERRRRQQQRQDEEDCLACCQVLCICLYCFALLAGGR